MFYHLRRLSSRRIISYSARLLKIISTLFEVRRGVSAFYDQRRQIITSSYALINAWPICARQQAATYALIAKVTIYKRVNKPQKNDIDVLKNVGMTYFIKYL